MCLFWSWIYNLVIHIETKETMDSNRKCPKMYFWWRHSVKMRKHKNAFTIFLHVYISFKDLNKGYSYVLMKSTFKRKVPLHARYKLYLIKTNLKACTEWMSYQLTCKRCWDAKYFSFIRENCSFTAPKQDKMVDDDGNSGCKKPNYLIVATSRR